MFSEASIDTDHAEAIRIEWARDERGRVFARDRAAFEAKRKRDYDLIRAKHQFGDGPPPPPAPEPNKPTKMPVSA